MSADNTFIIEVSNSAYYEALRLTSNRAMAQDIAQEVVIAILRVGERIGGSAYAAGKIAAKNRVIDIWRKNAVEKKSMTKLIAYGIETTSILEDRDLEILDILDRADLTACEHRYCLLVFYGFNISTEIPAIMGMNATYLKRNIAAPLKVKLREAGIAPTPRKRKSSILA